MPEQNNTPSPSWEGDRFDPEEWYLWYGEGAASLSEIFNIHVYFQGHSPRCEKRANVILRDGTNDIDKVRECLASLYEQHEAGLIDEEDESIHPSGEIGNTQSALRQAPEHGRQRFYLARTWNTLKRASFMFFKGLGDARGYKKN